jgi:preprotein translocase subunit SecE
MKGLINYIKESWNELLYKVTWPTWAELQNSVIVVMVASVIIALMIFVMDSSFGNLVKTFYNLFG